jgi:hypothetical protein
MKKPRTSSNKPPTSSQKPRTSLKKPPHTLDEHALAEASAGVGTEPPPPWVPSQHNETFVRRRARRGLR